MLILYLPLTCFYLTDNVVVQTSRSMILFQALMTGSLLLEATNPRLILHSFCFNKGECCSSKLYIFGIPCLRIFASNTWWPVSRGTLHFVSRESMKSREIFRFKDTTFTVPQNYITKQNKCKFWKMHWDSTNDIRPPSTALSDHVQQLATFLG